MTLISPLIYLILFYPSHFQGQAVSDWLRGGAIGHPKYDPYTHEIKADSRVTSDITRQVYKHMPSNSLLIYDVHI